MDKIFLTILNMSITATYVAAVVLVLRLLLKRAPKWISYSLWSIVLFRLVCPFSFTSSFSLLSRIISPSAVTGQVEYIPADIGVMAIPKVDVGISAFNGFINDSLPWTAQTASVNPLQIVISIGTAVWLTGFTAMLIYSVVSYMRLKRRISTATKIFGNIFETDKIDSPFVCGFFKPGIYLPIDIEEKYQSYILHHERTHLRRFDHVIKPFAFLVLSIHWFNPLVWIAFHLMSRDMEMSCDERVVKDLSHNEKASYGEALIHLAVKQPILSGSPLAFGESGIKGRVQNLLNYQKPAFWVVIVLVLVLILVCASLLSNPRSTGPDYSRMMDNLASGTPPVFQFGRLEWNMTKQQVLQGLNLKERDFHVGDNNDARNETIILNVPVSFTSPRMEAVVTLLFVDNQLKNGKYILASASANELVPICAEIQRQVRDLKINESFYQNLEVLVESSIRGGVAADLSWMDLNGNYLRISIAHTNDISRMALILSVEAKKPIVP